MTEYLAEQRNGNDDNAQPVTEPYSKDGIRAGALALIAERQHATIQIQRATIQAQQAEIARLNKCIKALEREALKEPRGFEMTEREFLRRRSLEDQHNSCEAGWNGRLDNTTGNFAHLD